MCVDIATLQPLRLNQPIIAYKIMSRCRDNNGMIVSLFAGNVYEIGKTYDAGSPLCPSRVVESLEYTKGFHAYEYVSDTLWAHFSSSAYALVKVELSDVTFRGYDDQTPIFIANRCKFLEVIENWVTDPTNRHMVSATDNVS